MNEGQPVAKTSISYVIPAFNAERTLAEAVRSIFDQNFTEGDEVIIVDDGSTDGTRVLAESLVKEFAPKVTLIVNEVNKGCPASRNVGIARAKNPFIFNLDSDNVLPKGSVAALREGIVRENADVAAFQEYRYFKTTTAEITHRWVCVSGIFTLADILGGVMNPAPGGNFLYRRAVWERIGRYDEYGKGLHEAWGFSLKLLSNGAKFAVIPDTFYFHRYSHESLFVRESKKSDEAKIVTNKFIAPLLSRLDAASQKYIAAYPDWFEYLDVHPLVLAADPSTGIKIAAGREGRIVFASLRGRISYSLRHFLRVAYDTFFR